MIFGSCHVIQEQPGWGAVVFFVLLLCLACCLLSASSGGPIELNFGAFDSPLCPVTVSRHRFPLCSSVCPCSAIFCLLVFSVWVQLINFHHGPCFAASTGWSSRDRQGEGVVTSGFRRLCLSNTVLGVRWKCSFFGNTAHLLLSIDPLTWWWSIVFLSCCLCHPCVINSVCG